MHPARTTWKFFFLCLLNLFIAAPIQFFFEFEGLVVTEILFFLLLAVFWARKRGAASFLRVREVPLSAFVWAIVLSVLAVPVASVLNSLVVLAAREVGMHYYIGIDPAEISYPPVAMFFVLAVIPGLCEEVMFRGFFLNAYSERLSTGASIALSAFLFGLIHYNIYNFFSPFYLGIVFGGLVYVYGSIIPAIIGHTVFNAFIYYMQLTVALPQGAEELITLRSILEALPYGAASLLLTALIFRRLVRLRRPDEAISAPDPEEEGEEALPPEISDAEPTRFPLSAWLPLLLSILLFGGMIYVTEMLIRGARFV